MNMVAQKLVLTIRATEQLVVAVYVPWKTRDMNVAPLVKLHA